MQTTDNHALLSYAYFNQIQGGNGKKIKKLEEAGIEYVTLIGIPLSAKCALMGVRLHHAYSYFLQDFKERYMYKNMPISDLRRHLKSCGYYMSKRAN